VRLGFQSGEGLETGRSRPDLAMRGESWVPRGITGADLGSTTWPRLAQRAGGGRYGVLSLLLYARDEDATAFEFFEFWRVLEHMQDSLAAAHV